MRHALLRELARFLEQALRRGRARRHAKLADEHERADLCVGLADLAREAQRLLRGVEATRWIGLREYLRFSCADRCERAIALRLLRERGGAPQAIVRALAVAVLRIEHGRVVEGAGDLIEETELLVRLKAPQVVLDGTLEVAFILVRLRDAGVEDRDEVAVAKAFRELDGALVDRERLFALALARQGECQIDEPAEVECLVLDD